MRPSSWKNVFPEILKHYCNFIQFKQFRAWKGKIKSILAFAFDVVAVKQCLSPGNHLMTNFGTKTKIFPPPGDLPSEYVFNCP